MREGLAIVLMGVSGCGKTTVGRLLAAALGCAFLEGDDFHTQTNLDKMRSGIPLRDEDRWPWLEALAAQIRAATGSGETVVVACSALKSSYREVLARGADRVLFVHLAGPPELVAARLAARRGHFMPPGLLASQYAVLEPPEGLTVSIAPPPQEIVSEILGRLRGTR